MVSITVKAVHGTCFIFIQLCLSCKPTLCLFPAFLLVVKVCMPVVQTFNKSFNDFLLFQFTSRMVEIARSTLVLSSGAAILPHPSKVIISLHSLLAFMHLLHLIEGQKVILLARSQQLYWCSKVPHTSSFLWSILRLAAKIHLIMNPYFH